MTEQKNLEIDLRRAVSARDEFLSIASHELRTPLSALGLQMGVLGHICGTNVDIQTIKARVGKIEQTAGKQLRRLAELIDDLLSVSRITSGHLALEREDIDLNLIIQEAVERLQAQAMHRMHR